MTAKPRIVLLTGNQLRHNYVASQFASDMQLVGLLRESKAKLVAKPEELSDEDRAIVEKHFAQRGEAERELLGEEIPLPDVPTRNVEHGGSNTPEVFDWVRSCEPDYIVLYGTSIIKDPLLSAYDGRMINIHLGLSPPITEAPAPTFGPSSIVARNALVQRSTSPCSASMPAPFCVRYALPQSQPMGPTSWVPRPSWLR